MKIKNNSLCASTKAKYAGDKSNHRPSSSEIGDLQIAILQYQKNRLCFPIVSEIHFKGRLASFDNADFHLNIYIQSTGEV